MLDKSQYWLDIQTGIHIQIQINMHIHMQIKKHSSLCTLKSLMTASV